jgi:Uma2 family endonuclease
MPAKLAEADQMTVEEFLAFRDSRPNGERWELVEGVAIMNAAPTQWHQRVASNIVRALDDIKIETGASWIPILGVGTRVPVSPNSLPQPDVYVQEGELLSSPTTDDALILFEVLSKSNTKRDQAWRRRVYASVPNCQHYVTLSTKAAEVVRYDRANGWIGTPVKGLGAKLALPAIGAKIPLKDIYRWTPIE